MFHIDKTISNIRFLLGHYRMTDRLYESIIRAGTIKTTYRIDHHRIKLDGLNDDVYIVLTYGHKEHYLDIMTDSQ